MEARGVDRPAELGYQAGACGFRMEIEALGGAQCRCCVTLEVVTGATEASGLTAGSDVTVLLWSDFVVFCGVFHMDASPAR